MDIKIRGFLGTLSMAALQSSIRLEEAGGLALFDCVVATDKNNEPINLCKFHLLAPGQRPTPIVLVTHGAPKPPNTGNLILTDVVVIDRNFSTLDFYRETV